MIEHEQHLVYIKEIGEWVNIDIPCIPMVLLLNRIGLITKYCCQGDKYNYFNIMFQDNITDKDIEDFLLKFENQYTHSPFVGKFVKWTRKMSGKIVSNWLYECNSIRSVSDDFNTIKMKFEPEN